MDDPLHRVRSRTGEPRLFASRRARRRVVVHALVVALVFVALTLLVRSRAALLTDPAALREFVRSTGVWGPVVLVALQAAQVVIAPVPGQVLALVAGYLFGAVLGTVYNLIGVTIGSAVAFWLSRRYGRPYVERVVHEDALASFDSISEEYAPAALFVFFLVPGLPDDLLCFVGGLTDVPLWKLVALAVVGRAPAFFLVNLVGDLLGASRWELAALLALLFVAISILGYLRRDRLLALYQGKSS